MNEYLQSHIFQQHAGDTVSWLTQRQIHRKHRIHQQLQHDLDAPYHYLTLQSNLFTCYRTAFATTFEAANIPLLEWLSEWGWTKTHLTVFPEHFFGLNAARVPLSLTSCMFIDDKTFRFDRTMWVVASSLSRQIHDGLNIFMGLCKSCFPLFLTCTGEICIAMASGVIEYLALITRWGDLLASSVSPGIIVVWFPLLGLRQ